MRQAWEQLLGRELLDTSSSGNENVNTNCFCHEDNHASLSIHLERGVWFCHATGNKGALADAVRIINGVSAAEAKAYVRRSGVVTQGNGARRARRADPPPLDRRIVDSYVRALADAPARREFAAERLGWDPETIRQFEIGLWELADGTQRYTIPILDDAGQIRNIRMYKPESKGVDPMISWKQGYGRARLFPIESLKAQTIFISEGEKDCIQLNQQIRRFAPDAEWGAITGTGGARTWNDAEWSPLFTDKDVVVVYDIDDPGKQGAVKVATSITPFARSVKVVTLDINAPPDADITDYFVAAGKSWDEFQKLVDDTEAFQPTYPDPDFGLWAPNQEEAADPGVASAKQEPASALPEDERAGTAEGDSRQADSQGSGSHRSVAGWDVPIPLEMGTRVPDFPTDVFPRWLGDQVDGVAEETQTPRDLPGMLALSALGTAIAKKVKVEVRPGWEEPVNLYVVVALLPGERKSAVFRKMTAPLERLERELVDHALPDIRAAHVRKQIAEQRAASAEKKAGGSGTGNPQQLEADAIQAAREAEEIEVPVAPRLIADDTTPEALATLLAEQGGRIGVLSAEGGIFEILAGRYSGGQANIEVFLKGHSGDSMRVDRKGRPPEHIPEPAITLGLTVQPDVIRALADKPGFRGRGLVARCLFSLPTSIVGYRNARPNTVPPAVDGEYERRLMVVGRLDPGTLGGAAHTLTLTPEALARVESFMAEIEPRLRPGSDLHHIADWASKLVGATVRIAGLLHVAANPAWGNPISLQTVEAAITIADYLVAHAKAAFDLMGADPELDAARRILAWLRQSEPPEFTKRDAFVALRGTFKKAELLDPPLALLLEHGYIRTVESTTPARPGRPASPRYLVNPHTYAHKSHNSQNPGSGHAGKTSAAAP